MKNTIVHQESMNTDAICGSPFACTNVEITIACVCECDSASERVFANVTLLLYGNMYYYDGPFGFKKTKKAVDPTVKNAKTAIAHEYNYHIMPAIAAADPFITAYENTAFDTVEDCRAECNNVRTKAVNAFFATLKATQEKENNK